MIGPPKKIVAWLMDQDPCKQFEIKEHRKRRSLSANAYFHVLVGKIADAERVSANHVKNSLIRDCMYYQYDGDKIPTFATKAENLDSMLDAEGIHVIPLEDYYVDGVAYKKFAFLRGSHTYDTREMSHLIELTVAQAKDSGIETLTPRELEEMMARYERQQAKKYHSAD